MAYRFYLQEAFPNWHESLIAELRLETGFHVQYENGAWLVNTNCKKESTSHSMIVGKSYKSLHQQLTVLIMV